MVGLRVGSIFVLLALGDASTCNVVQGVDLHGDDVFTIPLRGAETDDCCTLCCVSNAEHPGSVTTWTKANNHCYCKSGGHVTASGGALSGFCPNEEHQSDVDAAWCHVYGSVTTITTNTTTTTTTQMRPFSDMWHGHNIYVEDSGSCYRITIGVEVAQGAGYAYGGGACGQSSTFGVNCGHYQSTDHEAERVVEQYRGGEASSGCPPRTSSISVEVRNPRASLNSLHIHVREHPACHYQFVITDSPSEGLAPLDLSGKFSMSKTGVFWAGVASVSGLAVATAAGFSNHRPNVVVPDALLG